MTRTQRKPLNKKNASEKTPAVMMKMNLPLKKQDSHWRTNKVIILKHELMNSIEMVPANVPRSNVAIATDDLLPASGYIESQTDASSAANLNGKAFQFSHDTIYYDDLLDKIIDAPVCPVELEYVQIHDGGSIHWYQ